MEIKARDQWNLRHFLLCFSLAMSLLAFSFPSSVIGTTLAQPSFYSYMNLLDSEGEATSKTNSLIGAMSGVFQAGGVFGVLITTYIMEKWGRKSAVCFCSIIGLLGGALVVAAQNVAMFIVFKFVAGMSSWGFVVVIPVFVTELAPPALRGLFVGMGGFALACGYALATYMGLAFYYSTNPSTQWRGPYGISLIITAYPLLVMLWTPESPRWLLLANRVDDARQVVRRLHNLANHEQHHFAMTEFYQMQKQTEYDRTLNPSYMKMFSRPSYRKRVMMTVGYAVASQSTAILVINNYGPLIFASLGYDTVHQLVLQCGWITCGIAGNLTGALIIDKVGRKPLMLFGFGGVLVCLVVEAALLASFATPVPAVPNRAALKTCVALFYLFIYLYGCGVDVAGFTFFGEVYPNHLRAKGLAISVIAQSLTALVYLQVAATAFANIGWKFYLIFIASVSVSIVMIAIFIPETKGVALEEVAMIFGDRDEVVVFTEDIQVGDTENELVVKEHHGAAVRDNAKSEFEVTKHEDEKSV